MTFKQEINNIISKYNISKTSNEEDGWMSKVYPYKLYLPNLNTKWFLDFENKTRKCKFYTVYSRICNGSILEKVNEVIECNTYNGKCNRFPQSITEVENFISNIVMLDKCYNK